MKLAAAMYFFAIANVAYPVAFHAAHAVGVQAAPATAVRNPQALAVRVPQAIAVHHAPQALAVRAPQAVAVHHAPQAVAVNHVAQAVAVHHALQAVAIRHAAHALAVRAPQAIAVHHAPHALAVRAPQAVAVRHAPQALAPLVVGVHHAPQAVDVAVHATQHVAAHAYQAEAIPSILHNRRDEPEPESVGKRRKGYGPWCWMPGEACTKSKRTDSGVESPATAPRQHGKHSRSAYPSSPPPSFHNFPLPPSILLPSFFHPSPLLSSFDHTQVKLVLTKIITTATGRGFMNKILAKISQICQIFQ